MAGTAYRFNAKAPDVMGVSGVKNLPKVRRKYDKKKRKKAIIRRTPYNGKVFGE